MFLIRQDSFFMPIFEYPLHYLFWWLILKLLSFLGNIITEWFIHFLSTKYSVILSKNMQRYQFIKFIISVKFEQQWLFQLGKDASEVRCSVHKSLEHLKEFTRLQTKTKI